MSEQALLRWAIEFVRNSYDGGAGYSDDDLAVAAEYMLQGQDPWESAAAIQEGRALPPVVAGGADGSPAIHLRRDP
jgi:hypothetical protein